MKTVEAFIESLPEGVTDLTQSVPAEKFFSNLFSEDIGLRNMRALFNGFHSTCPNFKVGEDECPDCIAEHGFK